ncbi:MAG: histidine--tRNA ligase, partial [Actinobacteria bacterium]|nr:histidine--tRNA ligase [Actinomycetota bacterium]
SMKAADKSGARWAIIIGDKELAEGTVQIKHLESGSQRSVPADEVVGAILTGE